ncbi:hypothetical protein ACWCQ0_44710, partial [Streptomyces massasporeus]
GGMLVQWLDWRWIFFVNVPIALVIAFLTPRHVKESERHPGHFDLAGALTSTLGMVALVYGFIRAAQEGWSDPYTIGSFVAAVVLLAMFILIERRSQQPITPLHMFADRNRSGTYVIMLCLAAAIFGMFFFLTLFVQQVLGGEPARPLRRNVRAPPRPDRRRGRAAPPDRHRRHGGHPALPRGPRGRGRRALRGPRPRRGGRRTVRRSSG